MKISEQLRRAALGPTPHSCVEFGDAWVDDWDAWEFIRTVKGGDGIILSGLVEAECRMFLLFCSMAAKGEGK